MKLISLLLFIFSINTALGQGDPAPYLKGQSASGLGNQASTIFVPNNQSTKINAYQAVFDNCGNPNNLLANCGNEHSSFDTSWTETTTGTAVSTISVMTAAPLAGLKSYFISCAGGGSGGTCIVYQDVATHYIQQGLVGLQVTTYTANAGSSNLHSRTDGVTSTNGVLIPTGDSAYSAGYELPFITGSTSSGIAYVITVAAGQTYEAIIDQAVVSAQEVIRSGDASTIVAEAFIPATASCSWGVTSSSWADMATVAACPSATVVSGFTGIEDLPHVSFANLPSGRYELTAEVSKFEADASSETGCLRLTDGTNTGTPKCHIDNNTVTISTDLRLSFTTNTTTSPTFKIQGVDAYLINSDTTRSNSVRFILRRYASTSTYSSQNTDFGLKSWTPTGSWTSNSTYTGQFSRSGELMNGWFQVVTSGAPTSIGLTVNIPSGYTIDTAKVASNNTRQVFGNCYFLDTGVNAFSGSVVINSTTSLTVNGMSSTGSSAPVSPAIVTQIYPFTWGDTDVLNCHFSNLPIVGWGNSNVIVGSFKEIPTTLGSNGADIQSVYFGSGANCDSPCTTGTCTICNTVGTKITSVSWVSTGVYRLNGIDGLKYNCTGSGESAGYNAIIHNRTTSTSTYASVTSGYNTTAANSNYNSVTCTGIP